MGNYIEHKLSYDRMKLEISSSSTVSEREIHSYHEILFCEDAGITLRTENRQIETLGGQLFIIPRGKYHFFDLYGERPFTRLKISIPDDMLIGTAINLFSGDIEVLRPDESVIHILNRLRDIAQKDNNGSRSYHAYAAVMLLLCELELLTAGSGAESCQENDGAILRIIDYISKNLSGDLSVTALSHALNFSPSFLTHKFRAEMGISLHRYIVQKRLSYAKSRIEEGERPSKIYSECGYRDYSSFYKAYLGYFSVAPSEKE